MFQRLEVLHSNSRIFTFLANRLMTSSEQSVFMEKAIDFVQKWSAHDAALAGSVAILKDMLIVFAIDETQTGASGCSLDKLNQFMKTQEQILQIAFFDRLRAAYIDNSGYWHNNSIKEFEMKVKSGEISPNTLVLNTSPVQLGQLLSNLIVPVENSWLNRYLTSVKQ